MEIKMKKSCAHIQLGRQCKTTIHAGESGFTEVSIAGWVFLLQYFALVIA